MSSSCYSCPFRCFHSSVVFILLLLLSFCRSCLSAALVLLLLLFFRCLVLLLLLFFCRSCPSAVFILLSFLFFCCLAFCCFCSSTALAFCRFHPSVALVLLPLFLLQFLALRTGRNDARHYAKRAAAKQVFPTTGGADILRTTPLYRGITGFCDSRFFLLPAVITVKVHCRQATYIQGCQMRMDYFHSWWRAHLRAHEGHLTGTATRSLHKAVYGLITFAASFKRSTIVYIFVTLPTASFSVRP